MQFALAVPWWLLALILTALVGVAWGAYAGVIVPLTTRRRAALSTLRALTLILIAVCLLRPVRIMPPDAKRDAVVPVLVDVSRSMRLNDAGSRARIDVARDLVRTELVPSLSRRFAPEVWTFGDELKPARASDAFAAAASRSDLSGALRAVRERYRDRRLAAIVVVSDGGDTGKEDTASALDAAGVPIYTIGVGAPAGGLDREVLDVTAGDAALTNSSIDLSVSVISRGNGDPFDIRLLENGRPVDLRHVVPAAPQSPLHTVFTVSPSHDSPTVYTVEIPAAPGELVVENNRRSVMVEPPGRRRRVLMVEGAPAFEHSFIKRALGGDPALEIDSVVRKGKDLEGDTTFFVQGAPDRAPQLASGFPKTREALDQYDAVMLANVEPDSLSRTELDALASFVGERGGGLIVLGAKSFAQQGFVGTSLEQVLPVALTAPHAGVVLTGSRAATPLQVQLTMNGQAHPIMRLAATPDETAKRWRSLPPLFGVSPLGSARPGALVLAVVQTAEGERPLVAVQRYGEGRSMVFTGEAAWRWRMQMPSSDNTYELFWRQALRWLAKDAPDPVAIVPPESLSPGDTGAVAVDVRNASFGPLTDAQVSVRVTAPDGEAVALRPSLSDARTGRYAGDMRFADPGVYRLTADVRRGTTVVGTATRSMLIGGADREMTDPRLNDEVLRRVSRATGGSYLDAADTSRLPSLLASVDATPGSPRVEELWHNPWLFLTILALLSAEWTLRRRWGLR